MTNPCSYKKIAKKEYCPKQQSIIVTDTIAEVKLQALLDHTMSRLRRSEGSFVTKNKRFKAFLIRK